MSIPIIEFDEFIDVYKPIKNCFDPEAAIDGYMYETYGEEYDFVMGQKNVWTIAEESGELLIFPGKYYVNRLGFIITEKMPKTYLEVILE